MRRIADGAPSHQGWAEAPLIRNGTVTMFDATPNRSRSWVSMRPSWFRSVTTFGASLKTPSLLRSSMTATVSVVDILTGDSRTDDPGVPQLGLFVVSVGDAGEIEQVGQVSAWAGEARKGVVGCGCEND